MTPRSSVTSDVASCCGKLGVAGGVATFGLFLAGVTAAIGRASSKSTRLARWPRPGTGRRRLDRYDGVHA